ncbi:hypothetical protein D3C73_1133270 [compost metagenome]
MLYAISAVSSRFATPRTPSVPKYLPILVCSPLLCCYSLIFVLYDFRPASVRLGKRLLYSRLFGSFSDTFIGILRRSRCGWLGRRLRIIAWRGDAVFTSGNGLSTRLRRHGDGRSALRSRRWRSVGSRRYFYRHYRGSRTAQLNEARQRHFNRHIVVPRPQTAYIGYRLDIVFSQPVQQRACSGQCKRYSAAGGGCKYR